MYHFIRITLFLLVGVCGCIEAEVLPNSIVSKLSKDFPSYRLAEKNDFIAAYASIPKEHGVGDYRNTIIKADLNSDEIPDYTLLLISSTERAFTFVSFISRNKEFDSIVLSSSKWPVGYNGEVWEVMWLKQQGDYGLAKEKYFNAPGKRYPFLKGYNQKDIEEYDVALEKYKNYVVIEKTNGEYGFFEQDDLFYCVSSYYYEDSVMKSLSKCD